MLCLIQADTSAIELGQVSCFQKTGSTFSSSFTATDRPQSFISLTPCLIDESPGKQENGNPGDLRDDLGHLEVRDSLALDVVGQTGLGK